MPVEREISSDASEPLPYAVYREAGGILSEPDYLLTIGYIRTVTSDDRIMTSERLVAPDSDKIQYMHCASTLGADPTALGEALYSYIHRYRVGEPTAQGTPLISKTGDKSDQAVFAETLLLTGQYRVYAGVVSHNEHLFPWVVPFGKDSASRSAVLLGMLERQPAV